MVNWMKGAFMKPLFAQFSKDPRGFTLIELLIVIALLGALAVGLIGAIDPFEQLKKGADTGTRDLVNQVQTAIIRYYSVKNAMPFASDLSKVDLTNGVMSTALDNMTGAGELRADFKTIQAGSLTKVFVTGTLVPPAATVCYTPTSKSFQSDPNTKYNPDHGGALATDTGVVCKSANPAAGVACDWCIQ